MAFQPNTTPTPNWLYNGEMRKMNETELKVVLLVTRKTLGWFDPMTGNQRKEQDYISQSQFLEFTGQTSNTSIANAIQNCIKNGWIIAKNKEGIICDTPEKRARRKVWYQLGNVFIDKISGTESGLDSGTESGLDEDDNEHLVQKMEASGTENGTHLVQKVDSTKETITKETIQNIPVSLKRVTCPNLEEGHKGCIEYIDSVAKNNNLKTFVNYQKQIFHLHKLLRAGYKFSDITKVIDKLDKDRFYREKGWDFATVGNFLDKGGVR